MLVDKKENSNRVKVGTLLSYTELLENKSNLVDTVRSPAGYKARANKVINNTSKISKEY